MPPTQGQYFNQTIHMVQSRLDLWYFEWICIILTIDCPLNCAFYSVCVRLRLMITIKSSYLEGLGFTDPRLLRHFAGSGLSPARFAESGYEQYFGPDIFSGRREIFWILCRPLSESSLAKLGAAIYRQAPLIQPANSEENWLIESSLTRALEGKKRTGLLVPLEELNSATVDLKGNVRNFYHAFSRGWNIMSVDEKQAFTYFTISYYNAYYEHPLDDSWYWLKLHDVHPEGLEPEHMRLLETPLNYLWKIVGAFMRELEYTGS